MEVKRNKDRDAVIKKTGGNLIWGSINKTTFGTYWFRLQRNTNCLLSAVRPAADQVTRLYRSCLGVRSAADVQAAGCISQHRYAVQTYRLDATVCSLYTLLRYFAGFESSCWQIGCLVSLHSEIIFILLYPPIVKGIKEMERRKCGYSNALFCFIVKQEHKLKLRIYQER